MLLLDNIQQLEKKADDYNKTVEQLPEKLRSIQKSIKSIKTENSEQEKLRDYRQSLEPTATAL